MSSHPLTRRRVRAAARWMLRVGTALAVVAAGYLGYVLVRHDRPVTLPAPTGRFQVGRVRYTWTDHSRTDPLGPSLPTGSRRLAVWLWFPAARASGGAAAPYAPGAWGGLHFPAPAGWAETAFDKVDAHTRAGGRVARGRFPVVVLLPGLGFAAPQYSTLAVDLASHGFIVAGVTPTYSANLTVLDGHPVHASPRGDPSRFSGDHTPGSTRTALRLMRVWADDAGFAADRVRALSASGRFAGHVDPAHVAYLGHSFGGTSALEACRRDPRCAAAVDLDGGQFGPVVGHGLRAPLLLIGHQGSCVTALCTPANATDRADLSVARRLVSHARRGAWSVSIDATKHFDFTDYAAYYLAFPLRALLPLGSIDGDRALRITGRYVNGFLARTVGGVPTNPFEGQHQQPQVHVRAW